MSGWVLGFVIGAVVVLIVVVLLLLMIVYARKVAETAEAIHAALEQARDNTRPLTALGDTSAAAGQILVGARAAREALAGQEESR